MATSHLTPDDLLRATLAAVAPGGQLREGLDRILRGRTGALIVLGFDRTVESICSGGFVLDVEFSATRLRELAKMDGAIVLDKDATRVLRAAVQLLPDPTIETTESGTRHRTAERVAKQTGFPVISVSQSMRIVALYVGGFRYVLEDADTIREQIVDEGEQPITRLHAAKDGDQAGAADRRSDRCGTQGRGVGRHAPRIRTARMPSQLLR